MPRFLGRFGDLAGLDATSANLHTLGAALGLLNANGLQIRIETTTGAIVRVRYIVSELGAFAAYFASLSHNVWNLRGNNTGNGNRSTPAADNFQNHNL
jgi:hypothetical protein